MAMKRCNIFAINSAAPINEGFRKQSPAENTVHLPYIL